MIKEKSQYNNIDLFKIIFAVIVVMIHSTPFRDISDAASWYFSNTIANLAVPFFFVTSGFLLFGKLMDCEYDNHGEIVRKYLAHIIKMYLIWCLIWIPWKVLHFYNIGSFTIVDFIKYIRDIIFVSGGDALWYLPALATAIGAVYLLKYKFKISNTVIVVLSFVLYAVGCLISSWYGLFENTTLIDTYYNIFVSTDNGILNGMIFVSVGMIIAENRKNKSVVFDTLLCVIFLCCLFVESYIIKTSGLNYGGVCNNIVLPIAIYFVFKSILNIKIEGSETVFRKLRDYSTIIYLSHCFIIRSIKMVAGIVGIDISYTLLFIITLVLSFVFSAIVRYMAVNKKCAWFKLLY